MVDILMMATRSGSMRIQKIQIMAMAVLNTIGSMQLGANIVLAIQYRAVSTLANLAILFNFFDFFDYFNLATAVAHLLPSIHLILDRPSLVASNIPSDAPEPLLTRYLHCRCRKHCCRQLPTFREKILAVRELRTCTCCTKNPLLRQRGLCRNLLAKGMQL